MSEDSKFAATEDEVQAMTHEEREAQLTEMIKQFQEDWNNGWRPRPGAFLHPTTLQWKGDNDL